MRAGDATIRFVSGWGASWGEAAERCLMEAAERCSAQYFGDEPLHRARLAELAGAAVSPAELLLIGDDQFAGRAEWNRRHRGVNTVPKPWREDCRLDWIACEPSLGSGPGWLPAGLCLLGHDRDRGAGLPAADSNGIAAGASLEDAAARAFVELAERDAVAIWWYNRIARPRLRTNALDEPMIAAYARWCRGRGRVLALHDLTHDLRVPVAAAIAHDAGGGAIAFGFGAGRSMTEAARHAVGELAQCEANLALIDERVAEEGLRGLTPEARALHGWTRTARLRDHPHLVGGPMRAARDACLRLDLDACRTLCADRGLRLYVIDLTRSSIGVPVARAVVPGLRSLRARFAPGRLFDVPVWLGWRRRRLGVARLNPIPLMV